METKSLNKKNLFIIIFLIFSELFLFSENFKYQFENQILQSIEDSSGNKNYFTKVDDEVPLVYQTLKWQPGKYVKMYQVFIEILNEELGWIPYEPTESIRNLQIKGAENQQYLGNGVYQTTDSQLIVALFAKKNGDSQKYRYSVTLYNLLGYSAFSTDFMEFEIKKALIPEIQSSSKEYVYLDSIFDGHLSVRGTNLLTSTKFTLTSGLRNIPLIDMKVSRENDKADLLFDAELYDVGSWFIKAENPGGFVAEYPLEIRFQKPLDFLISVGYAPEISVLGKSFKNYFPVINPIGANIKIEVISIKRRFGFFGVGLSGNYFLLESSTEKYGLSSYVGGFFVNGVYHKVFGNKKFRFQSRLGAGVVGFLGMQFNFTNGLSSPEFTTFYLAANIGCSLSYYINSSFFVDIGFDWQQVFMPNEISGFVVPSLSVGYQF